MEETIQERVVREEREAQEKRLAEMRAERERAEREAAEAAERQRLAKIEADRKAQAEAERRAEQAKRDAEARAVRNAERRKGEIERLEKKYVMMERMKAALDSFAAFRGESGDFTYTGDFDKHLREVAGAVSYNLDDAKRKLLDPAPHFRRLGIAD